MSVIKTLVSPRFLAGPPQQVSLESHAKALAEKDAECRAEIAKIKSAAMESINNTVRAASGKQDNASQLRAELATVKAELAQAKAHDIRQSLPAAPAPTSAPPTGKPWNDNVRWQAYEHVLQHRGPEAANQWAKTFLPRAVRS